MWHLLEPLHAVLYYAPEAFEEAAALGFDVEERWPSYFAWRAAPLAGDGPGPDADEVVRTFHSFSPATVRRYVPAAWGVAAPAEVLAARSRAVDRAYRTLFGERVEGPEFAEAAALARRAAERAATGTRGGELASGVSRTGDLASGASRTGGPVPFPERPLADANAALPWPGSPHLVLWQAATVLREHRGDGHVAALVAAGLDPVESLVSFAAVGAAPVDVFASRGWSPDEWAAARRRLHLRGLVDAAGTATEAGRALRTEVERHTDEAAAQPWGALDAGERERLVELLGTWWLETIGSGLLPSVNTLGIGRI